MNKIPSPPVVNQFQFNWNLQRWLVWCNDYRGRKVEKRRGLDERSSTRSLCKFLAWSFSNVRLINMSSCMMSFGEWRLFLFMECRFIEGRIEVFAFALCRMLPQLLLSFPAYSLSLIQSCIIFSDWNQAPNNTKTLPRA